MAQVTRQRAITAGTIGALAALIGLGINWTRKRKQQLEWAKERAKQEERMQISQRVHDVVANGLYQVMKEMEYAQNVNSEELVDKIEVLYNQSRDISYEADGGSEGEVQRMVARILSAYGNADRKVAMIGNNQSLWSEVRQVVQQELKPILQELMINMDKHSGARNVLVRFDREGQGLLVQYQDDGVGMPAHQRFGNGLTNTGNRIAGMGGRISFEPNTPGGLKIRIFLPND
jgi:signal transduction histidine kinase